MVHDGGISPLPAPVSQLHHFAYVLKQDVRRSKRSVRRNLHTSYTIHPMSCAGGAAGEQGKGIKRSAAAMDRMAQDKRYLSHKRTA